MQRYRVVIMIVLFGVLPVVAAFFFALSYLSEQEAPTGSEQTTTVAEPAPTEPEPPPATQVLASARALPVGSLINEDDLVVVEMAPDEVRGGYVVLTGATGVETLRGHAIRVALAEGAPLAWSAVVGPGQSGFLAAVLRPGTRAVTIQVGEATGYAGLVDPGDRVDVIMSARLESGGGTQSVFARTIVEDVRVVAVDRRVATDRQSTDEGERKRSEVTTATLEVSPAQGDRLILGEHEGRLSLAVRSLARDAAPPQSVAVDLRELLMPPAEFAESEGQLKRERELTDISTRTQIVNSRAQLESATGGNVTGQTVVKVIRGTDAAKEVLFLDRKSTSR